MNLPPLPEIGPDGQRPVERTIRVLIAHELIRSRMAAGLSQRQLAVAAGVDARTVHSIESCTGRGSEQTMIRIRKALATARTATPPAPTTTSAPAAPLTPPPALVPTPTLASKAAKSPASALPPMPGRPTPPDAAPPATPRTLLTRILRTLLK